MEEIYDVVIVGAGLAGLSVAEGLNDSGLNVLVVERHKDLNRETFNLKATFRDTVKNFKVEDSVAAVYTKTGFFSQNVHSVVDMSREPALLVDVYKLLEIMRKRNKNISFEFSKEIIRIEKYPEYIKFTDSDGKSYYTKLAVIATGNSSALCHQMGIRREKTYFKFYGFELDKCNIDPKEAVFLFDKEYTQSGWWVYPISKNRCQIVIGEIEPLVETTKGELRTNILRVIREFKPYDLSKAKIIPNTDLYLKYPISPLERMSDDRVLIIGDAGGQSTPIMGEGVRIGLEMGLEASKVIKKAFKKNKFSKDFMKRLDKRWWKKFGKYYFWGIIMRHIIVCNLDNEHLDMAIANFAKLSTKDQYRFMKSQFNMGVMKKITSYKMLRYVLKNIVKSNILKILIKNRRQFISKFV